MVAQMQAALSAGLLLIAAAQGGLQLGELDAPRPKARQLVAYAPEAQTVLAGKPAVLVLRFRIEGGYHINSHRPASELQIPTAVKLVPEVGVHLEETQYPAGQTYAPAFNPSGKLDVYTGDFAVQLPVLASAGSHTLHGSLKYQACDRAACYPVKTLSLDVPFVAR